MPTLNRIFLLITGVGASAMLTLSVLFDLPLEAPEALFYLILVVTFSAFEIIEQLEKINSQLSE